MRRNYPARKGQGKKDLAGKTVHAEEWQVEIAKDRLGLLYAELCVLRGA